MQLEISQIALQEILAALQLKILLQLGPQASLAAAQEIQTAITNAQKAAPV